MRNWNEIIGHDRIKEYLRDAVKKNKPGHAYIFNGGAGIGKRTMADIFVKSLMCTGEGEKPCGQCRSCKQVDSGNSPDLFRVTHEKQAISVEDVRSQIVSPMGIKPYESEYKIFIVDEAEKMNSAAQNALLKTFEEPPEYGIIILLTENADAFLETIRSRAITLNFGEVQQKDVIDFLVREKKVPDYLAASVAACAGGCPGKAYRWIDDDDFQKKLEDGLRILRKLERLDTATVIDTAKSWAKNKDEVDFFLNLFEIWIRDVLLIKSTGRTGRCLLRNETDYEKGQAERKEYRELARMLDLKEDFKARIKANVNLESAAEDFLLSL